MLLFPVLNLKHIYNKRLTNLKSNPMKTLNKYHGVVVPMVTPITKNNEIDIDAVKRIIPQIRNL